MNHSVNNDDKKNGESDGEDEVVLVVTAAAASIAPAVLQRQAHYSSPGAFAIRAPSASREDDDDDDDDDTDDDDDLEANRDGSGTSGGTTGTNSNDIHHPDGMDVLCPVAELVVEPGGDATNGGIASAPVARCGGDGSDDDDKNANAAALPPEVYEGKPVDVAPSPACQECLRALKNPQVFRGVMALALLIVVCTACTIVLVAKLSARDHSSEDEIVRLQNRSNELLQYVNCNDNYSNNNATNCDPSGGGSVNYRGSVGQHQQPDDWSQNNSGDGGGGFNRFPTASHHGNGEEYDDYPETSGGNHRSW